MGSTLGRLWLPVSALLVIVLAILIVSGHRTPGSWLALAAAVANLMTFVVLWRRRSRRGCGRSDHRSCHEA